jgi:zinc/manganese transport system permease protein
VIGALVAGPALLGPVAAGSRVIDFGGTAELLALPFVRNALLAGAVLGLLAGLLGPLAVGRGMSFAVHGTSELTFTGAAAALLFAGAGGVSYGALVAAVTAAVLFGLFGVRERERDSAIGVVLSFGLGLGVAFLALYPGRAANKFGLLIGQIVGVDRSDLTMLAGCGLAVVVVLAVIYRPLLFATFDVDLAAARGVPVRVLSVVFPVLIGVTTALGVQIVGALLVIAMMITPAAAAIRVSANPLTVTVLAVLFAEVSILGGIVLSLGPGLPVSPYVTTIAFLIYLTCRSVDALRTRRGASHPRPAAPVLPLAPRPARTP